MTSNLTLRPEGFRYADLDVSNKINISKTNIVLRTYTHNSLVYGLEGLALHAEYQHPGKRVKRVSRASVIDCAESARLSHME